MDLPRVGRTWDEGKEGGGGGGIIDYPPYPPTFHYLIFFWKNICKNRQKKKEKAYLTSLHHKEQKNIILGVRLVVLGGGQNCKLHFLAVLWFFFLEKILDIQTKINFKGV